jgi:hypothetical protein
MVGEPDRQWLREAARAFAHEWAAFFATVWRVTRAPRRFAADWADGKIEALNPILYTLNAVALQTPWVILWNRIAHRPDADLPLWAQALGGMSEFFNALLWTLPLHGVLRLIGGRRPLRSTYAISLYVIMGPLTLLALPVIAVSAFAGRDLHALHPSPLVLLLTLSSIAFLMIWIVYASLALGGLMRMRARLVAAVFTVILIGALVLDSWLASHHKALAHVLVGSS